MNKARRKRPESSNWEGPVKVIALLALVAFAIAPESTPIVIDRFKGWLARNGAQAIAIGLAVIGVALVLRGALAAAA